MMNELITRNAIVEGMVYLQITRGIADRDFAFPAGITSSIVAFASVLNLMNNPAAESGIPVITTPDLRWKRRDIKSVNLLGQVLAKQGGYECICTINFIQHDLQAGGIGTRQHSHGID